MGGSVDSLVSNRGSDIEREEALAASLVSSQDRSRPFDVAGARQEFPILQQRVHQQPLVYLDNGATTQKPQTVIDIEASYYQSINANVHRGAHFLSEEATLAFERARARVAEFINAGESCEILWTKGTTESINLVAATLGRAKVRQGDNVVITAMEHHSNIVPWQMLCQVAGAELRVVAVTDVGELDLDDFQRCLDDRTRLVALTQVSNALGTINPVKALVENAHAVGASVLVDGAQAVSHGQVDVQQLNCDFYAFSSHKLFGPTGVGVLYGKRALLEEMPPYQFGGEMIEHVSFSATTFNALPYKFEAGTPNIAGVLGLAAAIDYLASWDEPQRLIHEQQLLDYAHQRARDFGGMKIIGQAAAKTGILSFLLEGTHPHDVGTLLDQQGIAVRTGHHCAMPLMERFKLPGTVRASFSFYNTLDEIDQLFNKLTKVKALLS